MEKIYVFGNGQFSKKHMEEIKSKYVIEAILDNNASGNILNPNDFKFENNIKVLVMVRDFFSVINQLSKLGIDEKNIIFGDNQFYDLPKDKLIQDNSIIKYENGVIYFQTDRYKKEINNYNELQELRKELLRYIYSSVYEVKSISCFSLEPVTRDWGMSRGTAIDRVYIERFLDNNRKLIRGETLEIGDNTYTQQFGNEKVVSNILHVQGWGGKNVIKGNFETGEGLENYKFDTLIITQTLMFIYDLESAVDNIWNVLNEGGHALITVSGISQISRYDADNWGSFWGFHKDALVNLFVSKFGEECVEINTYGNVKTACAMLYGICSEELDKHDFEYDDQDYPIIHTIILTKK